jgi:hypothetical protein
VSNEEIVYRLVKMDYVVQSEDGEWHPTKDAFRGRDRRISVDRAAKCNYDPSYTQKGIDPVCRLRVGEVRSIDIGPKFDSKGRIIDKYEAYVEATPQPCNDAHADIYAHPEKASDRAWKLLREGLAAIYEWEEGFAPTSRGGV